MQNPLQEKAYQALSTLGVAFERVDNSPAASMEDCHVIGEKLNTEVVKNIFLCNRQQTVFYLLIMPGTKPFKTKYLSAQIGSSRLSFAGAADMERLLGVTPGSVSVLGLKNDKAHAVQLLVDRELLEEKDFGCHPCKNTSSLRFSTQQLREKLLPALEHEPIYVNLPWEFDEQT